MRSRTPAGRRRAGLLCAAASIASVVVATSTGAPPAAAAPVECPSGAVTHTIAQVQGTGAASPLVGSTVTARGVVVADLRSGGHHALHVQTIGTGGVGRPVGSGVASDGIVIDLGADPSAHPVATLGDVVQVTGVVGEQGGATRITTASAASTLVCTVAGSVAATPLALPLADAARESLEGMLVAPAGSFTVSGVADLARRGDVVLAAGTAPARVPTDAFPAGSDEAIAQHAANRARRIVLGDGRTVDLVAAGQAPPYLRPSAPRRVGDRVAAFGPVVLSQGAGEWQLVPTRPVTAATTAPAVTTFTAANPRRPAPDPVGGDVRVATFDLGAYLVHVDGTGPGAVDEAALARQEAKLVAAITRLDAGVVALQGIETSARFPGGDGAALRRLVAALDAVDGPGSWAWTPTSTDLPSPGRQDDLTAAFLYRPAVVTPIGVTRSVDDDATWGRTPEPIAQTFRSGDVTFAVVAVHLTDRGGPAPATGPDADRGDGQGAFNGERVRQAHALVAFLDGIRATASDDVLVVGTTNAFTQEDPMQVLFGAGYAEVAVARSSTRTTDVVGGEVGSLDHVLASRSMLARITGHDRWEINAHEASAFAYDGDPAFFAPDPFRSSARNPEVVGIETGAAPTATGARYVPATPCRLFDSRPAPALAPSATVDVRVRGGGACAVPPGATAASFTVHAVEPPAGPGYVRFGAPGAPGGGTTVVNHAGGFRSVSNTVNVPVPAGDTMRIRNLGSYSSVVIDLQGWFVPEGPSTDGTVFVPMAGCRLGPTTVASGAQATVRVAGRCSVPAGAAAVELSVSSDRATVPAGRPRVYARVGGTVPSTTFLNVVAGEAATNTGPVALSGGDVRIRSVGPTTTYVLDVRGYYVSPAAVPAGEVGLRYEPLATCRAVDTRTTAGAPPSTVAVDVARRCQLPARTRALHVALSAIEPRAAGFVRPHPLPGARPPATLLSHEARRSVTNAGNVALGANGIGIWSLVRPELVLDVTGAWTAAGP